MEKVLQIVLQILLWSILQLIYFNNFLYLHTYLIYFFVFRNLNTIRAINQELGEPVDRLVLMAKWLVEIYFCLFCSSVRPSVGLSVCLFVCL